MQKEKTKTTKSDVSKNKELVKKLVEKIEENLNWGPSDKWVQRDFDNLAELIFDNTKVSISLSTLKRIWKGNFKQLPNVATLDALVQFAGYNNWGDFKVVYSQFKSKTKTPALHSRKTIRVWILVSVLVTIIAAVSILLLKLSPNKINYELNPNLA